jgi:hypothetical protein
MVIEMDLVATKFDCHHWMANKMDFIIAIRWQPKPFWSPSSLVTTVRLRPKRGEYDCLFQSPTRMGDFLKNGCHLTITISWMEIEVFNC